MVLAERGQYDLAQRQFEKAMSIYVRQNKERQQRHQTLMDDGESGSDSNTISKSELQAANMNRDVASVISCIGNVKNRVGELDAALTKYLQALQIYKSLYELKQRDSKSTNKKNNNHNNNNNVSTNRKGSPDIEALRDVTSTLKVIGMVHAKRGDLDTAMQFFQEAMDLLRKHEAATPSKAESSIVVVVDDETANTTESTLEANQSVIRETEASILSRIASIHLKKGELDEAMASYREAYDLTVQNRGNTTNHPEIAGILHYIGGIYHKRGCVKHELPAYCVWHIESALSSRLHPSFLLNLLLLLLEPILITVNTTKPWPATKNPSGSTMQHWAAITRPSPGHSLWSEASTTSDGTSIAQ
jgi:tetratricopeptide (TPR) repeat protein